MNYSELLAKTIYQQNIKTVFVTSECMSFSLVRDMEAVGINVVLCYQAYLAGLLAGAYANLESNIGVVITSDSPKQVTDLNKCLNAHYFDHNPVVAIKLRESTKADNGHIKSTHSPAIVKSNVFFNKKRNLVQTLYSIRELALEGTPGPALLTLPTSFLQETTELSLNTSSYSELSIFKSSTKEAHLFKKLQTYNQMVVVIGSSLVSSLYKEIIFDMIDKYKLPFVITPMAKKIICGNHPLCLGVLTKNDQEIMSFLYSKKLLLNIGFKKEDWSYIDYSKVDHIELNDKKSIENLKVLSETYTSTPRRSHLNQALNINTSVKPSVNIIENIWDSLSPENILITGKGEVKDEQYKDITPTLRKKLVITSKNESILLTALVTKITYPEKKVFVVCNSKSFNTQIDLLCLFRHYGVAINIVIIKETVPFFKFSFDKKIDGNLSFVSNDKIDLKKLNRYNLKINKLEDLKLLFEHNENFESNSVKICEIPENYYSRNVYYEKK